MSKSKYSKEFKLKVAKEALLPENYGLERVVMAFFHPRSYGGVNTTKSTEKLHFGEDIQNVIRAVHEK